MKLQHLELLRELAARGTLAAVAEATFRTPSAVSQQVRTAERELGLRLVEPASRGVRLTPAGEMLAAGAADIAERLAELRAAVDASLGEPRGTVRIGTLPSAGEALLPPLIGRLRESAIQLELEDFDLAEEDFSSRTLDADIVIGHSLSAAVPRGAEKLRVTHLVEEPIDVALPSGHPLAAREFLKPRDLVSHTWIGVPARYPFDAIPVAVEQLTGETIERTVRLRDNRLVESLVAADLGIALLPRFTTRPRPGVVLRPLHELRASRSIMAMSRPERYARQAVKTVTENLVQIGAALRANDLP